MKKSMLKKAITLLTLLTILLTTLGIDVPVAYATNDEVSIQGTLVDEDPTTNVRAGPGTSYQVIKELQRGSTVTVIGTSGSWYKVKINGECGFVYQGLVQIASAEGTICDTTPTNVRRGPGNSYEVIGVLQNGELVKVVGKEGSWSKIFFGEEIGYVYSALIDTSTSVSESEQENTEANRFDAVGTASSYADKIVVDKSDHILTVLDQDGETLMSCVCTTAKEGYETPTGKYHVNVVSAMQYTRISLSGNVKTYERDEATNPFYIYVKCKNIDTGATQYIHGTGGWLLLGGDYSNGCIRIADENVKRLITFLPRKNNTGATRVEVDSSVTLVIQD